MCQLRFLFLFVATTQIFHCKKYTYKKLSKNTHTHTHTKKVSTEENRNQKTTTREFISQKNILQKHILDYIQNKKKYYITTARIANRKTQFNAICVEVILT